jgi:hypothetical protein
VSAGTGYPRIAGAGMVFYPWRVAGADSGINFGSRIRVYKVCIRADFTRYRMSFALHYKYNSSLNTLEYQILTVSYVVA